MPPPVAEQFALQQGLGNGGAVHSDKRLGAAVAGIVNEPRQKLLAGSAFGLNQNIGAAAGRCTGTLQSLQQKRRSADNLAIRRGFMQRLLVGACNHLRDHGLQAVEWNRLDEVVQRAVPHGVYRVRYRAIGGEENDGSRRRGVASSAHHLDAAAIGHAHVGDHQIESLHLKAANCLAHAGGRLNLPAVANKVAAERGANARLVVDNHH